MLIYQVENLRVQNWKSLVLSYYTLVICQVDMEMARLRYLQWERSYLVHNVELRQLPMLEAQMGGLVIIQEDQQVLGVASLRVLHQEVSQLVKMVDPRQAPPIIGHMGVQMEILRNLHWDRSNLVKMVEMRQAPLMNGRSYVSGYVKLQGYQLGEQ